jgi:hypothetical protein
MCDCRCEAKPRLLDEIQHEHSICKTCVFENNERTCRIGGLGVKGCITSCVKHSPYRSVE